MLVSFTSFLLNKTSWEAVLQRVLHSLRLVIGLLLCAGHRLSTLFL